MDMHERSRYRRAIEIHRRFSSLVPKEMSYRILTRPPVAFRFFRQLILWDVPGAWTLSRIFGQPRWKDVAAPFELDDGSVLYLPLLWPGLLTGRGLASYEPDAIACFAAAVRASAAPVTLIDCGADTGVFARLIAAQAHNIATVVAFEPNPLPFQLLKMNLGTFAAADPRCAAVSSQAGEAVLVLDAAKDDSHAGFITTGAPGGLRVPVQTVDQLAIDPASAIALKIDVEGEERAVLQGAEQTLRRAPAFVVQFEAHPDVAKRTGLDPGQCLAFLQSLGAEEWTAFCERTRETVTTLSPDKPFFDQVDPNEIYDVVAVRHR